MLQGKMRLKHTLLTVLAASSLTPFAANAQVYDTYDDYVNGRHWPAQQFQQQQDTAPPAVQSRPGRYIEAPPAENVQEVQVVRPQPSIKPLPPTPKPPVEYYNAYSKAGISADLQAGWRTDSLDWNIASDINWVITPNILSELKWEDVSGYQIAPSIEYTNPEGRFEGFHLEASGYSSATTKGDNQDSDYLDADRGMEFSRSNNNSEGGGAMGISGGIGYAFDFKDDHDATLFRFLTLVGYSVKKQKFTMTEGNQTVETVSVTPALGPFAGLDSSYEMEWSSPFIGAALEGFFAERHHLKLSGRYYQGSYHGEANWNLRSDFAHPKSYEHEADSQGYSFGGEYSYMFAPRWEFKLSAEYTKFSTEPGVDTTYFADDTFGTTRLNAVHWESQQYMAGIGFRL